MPIANPSSVLGLLLLLGGMQPAPMALADAPIAQRSLDAHGEARRALARGDLRTAQIHLRNALRHDPRNLEARYDLGVANLRAGDFAAAEKDLHQAWRGGLPEARVLPDYATALLLQQKFAKLLEEVQIGGRAALVEARLRSLRGAALASLDRLADAAREFQESLALHPTAAAQLGLARLAVARRDTKSAQERLDAALALDAENAEAWLIRGDLLRVSGDRQAARAAFDRAIALDDRLLAARAARADLAIAESRVDDIVADADAILSVNPRHPQGLYLRALVLAHRGDMARAGELMQQIQGFARAYPAALYLSALVNASLDRVQQAETELTQVLAARPNHLPARRLLGTLHLRRGDAERALQILQPAREDGARDLPFLALLGEALMRTRRFADAVAVLSEAARLDPEDRRVQANLGASHLQAGQREAGIGQLERALAGDPKLASAADLLIEALIRGRDFDRARAVVASLRDRLGDSPLAAFYAGAIARAAGDPDAAMRAFAQALDLAPDYRQAALHLAALEAAQGRGDAAVAVLERQLAAAPRDGQTMLGLAALETRRGRQEAARQWLERAVASDREAVAPRLALAMFLLQLRETEKALVVARDLLTLAPQDIRAIELAGRVHLARQDPASAATLFRRAAALAQDAPAVQLRLAEALAAAEDGAGARAAIDAAIRLQPGFVPAWAGRLTLEAAQSGVGAALRLAERLRRDHPQSGWIAALMIGDLHRSAADLPAARAAYEQALASGPETSEAAARLFALRLQAGESAEAALGFARARLARLPADVALRFQVAAFLLAQGRETEAIAETEALLRLVPDHVAALNNLAWLYDRHGDARARDLAARAHGLAPDDPRIADTYGWILFRGGDTSRGIALLRAAATAAPRAGEIQHRFAEALAASGARDEARAVLDGALADGQPFPGREAAERLLQMLR